MRKIKAVFKKQLQSYIRNPGYYVMPLVLLGIPFANIFFQQDLTPDVRIALVTQFVVMFTGMAMISSSSAILREDRTTMNLRFMGMAGVRPWQYLIATSAVLMLVSMGFIAAFGALSGHSGGLLINFMLVGALATFNSILFGITIGLSPFWQLTMLFAMLLGVGPIFAGVNPALERIFSVTYTHHFSLAINDLGGDLSNHFQVMLINTAVFLVVFLAANTRYGLDGEKI